MHASIRNTFLVVFTGISAGGVAGVFLSAPTIGANSERVVGVGASIESHVTAASPLAKPSVTGDREALSAVVEHEREVATASVSDSSLGVNVAASIAAGGLQHPGVPDAVLKKIRERAVAEYPTDYVMQRSKIKWQCEAFIALQSQQHPGVPDGVLKQIRERAVAEYPTDYVMQQSKIKWQCEAFIALQSQPFPGVPDAVLKQIRERAIAAYPTDYAMQQSKIKWQCEAFIALQSQPFPGVPDAVLKQIRERAVAEYPTDYSMQQSKIKWQCDAYTSLKPSLSAP